MSIAKFYKPRGDRPRGSSRDRNSCWRPLSQEISVPVKGDYYLRIGIRDLDNTNVGAVEVPVETIKNLASTTPAHVDSAPPKSEK